MKIYWFFLQKFSIFDLFLNNNDFLQLRLNVHWKIVIKDWPRVIIHLVHHVLQNKRTLQIFLFVKTPIIVTFVHVLIYSSKIIWNVKFSKEFIRTDAENSSYNSFSTYLTTFTLTCNFTAKNVIVHISKRIF